MSIIDIQHITKDYGEGRGVFDVSFQVHKGEVMGFLGPNGAGKTTTIRQLMGFLKPDSGNVRILGMDCFHDAHKIAGSLGYLPGEIAFIDSMSGTEFIRFIARMKEMKDTGRADELMKRFALDPSTKIKKMSKGTKQKIGIICAFMQDPDILLLDEPTSGLDPLMQNAFIELILEEKKRGKTILLSSHIFEEIEKTCDRAAIIRNGRLVAVEDMEHLAKNKQKLIDLRFPDENTARDFASSFQPDATSIVSVRQNGSLVTVQIKGNIDALIKAASRYTVNDLDIRTQTLEEIFMHFYGGDANA
ncbi:ABC transporter ATP-binding protein [Faecalicatena contorta]|uniref:ABC transporter ATP-binding protein n=1 Tax=Faecalicatena contorta TaxID=39482 RepID=UPI001F1B4749|nr:ABC transporter ATP-binding protein [Faecalicatena contorta]MCF2555598.1 ABC transporter ATP-binding protein [Faecalicatena contorta]MCF2679942.1 ABC transporter ATP-binding protein [Faecalicatena contorta]